MNSPVIANAVNRLVIANAVKQSMTPDPMDCRVAGAPRNDGLFLFMNSPVIANAVNRLVIANAVKQSMTPDCMDCRVTTFLAMTATFTMTSLFMEIPSTLRQAQDRLKRGNPCRFISKGSANTGRSHFWTGARRVSESARRRSSPGQKQFLRGRRPANPDVFARWQ